MLAGIGKKQLKLVASWLSSAANVAGHPELAHAIKLALDSGDLIGSTRGGHEDIAAAALRRVLAAVEKGTKQAFLSEFGTNWEDRADLSATIHALPQILDKYAPTMDEIYDANVDPARIAAGVTRAADAAGEDLFRKGTPGERMLYNVILQSYEAAFSKQDPVLEMLVRGQQEVLNRQDKQGQKLDILIAQVHQMGVPVPTLQRILVEGFGEPNVVRDRAAIEEAVVTKSEEYRALREEVGRNREEQYRAIKITFAGLEKSLQAMSKDRQALFFSIMNDRDPITALQKSFGWKVWSDNYWGSIGSGYYLVMTHDDLAQGRVIVTRKPDIDSLKRSYETVWYKSKAPNAWHHELERASQHQRLGPILALDYSYFGLYEDPSASVGGVIYRENFPDTDFYAPLCEWCEKIADVLGRPNS